MVRLRPALVALGAAWLLAPAALAADERGPALLELTDKERSIVVGLAESALRERGLLKGKVYLTRVEVFRDTADRESERNALVTHYRYDGDVTVFTSVNLGRRRVTSVQSEAHFPASLAPEELAEAEKLARAHPEVKRALAKYGPGVEVDALLTYTADPKSPNYNHRVVRLFFRRGRDYLLYGPGVDVDLTAGTVRAERVDRAHE
jgi:hypothetical protein